MTSGDDVVPYEQIRYEVRDDVVVITLDRPDRLNAWTPRMSAELTDAIERADADPAVGAVVVTGEGKGFCAGADIEAVFEAQIQGDSSAGVPATSKDWIELVRTTKPIVAAVNGAAIGIGLTMILPFDRIVAADGAKLSVRFVKMGLVPELASSTFLPLRCGWGAANDLMLSGRTILADEAVRLGLADELAPAGGALDVAIGHAREYAANPTPQLRWIKELLTQNASETDTHLVQKREAKRLFEAYASEEHKVAVAAYLSR